MAVSSAYDIAVPFVLILNMQLMYMVNRIGPEAVPCGIRYTTAFLLLRAFPILTYCVLFCCVDTHMYELSLVCNFL